MRKKALEYGWMRRFRRNFGKGFYAHYFKDGLAVCGYQEEKSKLLIEIGEDFPYWKRCKKCRKKVLGKLGKVIPWWYEARNTI